MTVNPKQLEEPCIRCLTPIQRCGLGPSPQHFLWGSLGSSLLNVLVFDSFIPRCLILPMPCIGSLDAQVRAADSTGPQGALKLAL